jgi:hypothetical protein
LRRKFVSMARIVSAVGAAEVSPARQGWVIEAAIKPERRRCDTILRKLRRHEF